MQRRFHGIGEEGIVVCRSDDVPQAMRDEVRRVNGIDEPWVFICKPNAVDDSWGVFKVEHPVFYYEKELAK